MARSAPGHRANAEYGLSMRRAHQRLVLALSAALLTGFGATHAFAQDATDDQAQPSADTPAPKKTEDDVPPQAASQTEKPAEAPATTPAPAPAAETDANAAKKPKVGDTTVTGYLRGGFG